MDIDPLDEYLSSSSSANAVFSSGEEDSKGGRSDSGDDSITFRERGNRDKLPTRDGTVRGRGRARAGEARATNNLQRDSGPLFPLIGVQLDAPP